MVRLGFRGMPRTRREKAAAGTGSSGEMLHKKAAASLIGGVPMVHPGEEAAGSSGEMMHKKAAASLIGGVPMVHLEEEAAGSSGEMLREMAAAASSGEVPTVYPGEGAAVTGSGSSGAMPQKKATSSRGGSAALVALHGNATAQDSEEFAAEHRTKKARTASSLEIPQKHCTEDNADMGLSGGMLQKQSSKVEAITSLSGEMVHEHPVKEADTAKNFQKSDSNEIVHVKLENEEVQEAELLIKKLDDLGLGEHVSDDEFLVYFNRLPCRPPRINRALKLTNEELDKQDVRHALCRFRYYKHKLKEEGKEDTLSLKDISEDECDQEFLEKQGFFTELEENWTIDWFFHPDYCKRASLNDYQRLVLRNYGGTEYGRWSEYHKFLHSHDTEEEYVKYSEELFKQLKWMEGYLNSHRPSYKWDCISSRGALQAIKIAATTFHKITGSLAYHGYYECIESMGYDLVWFKELDDVYFEIWLLVTQGTMSFKDALEEVYKLNRFPLRQRRMKGALEHDYTMKNMEEEFHTCTAAIHPGVKEDKAKELIKEAVIKRVDKPKFYEQYIRKKIEIARIVGILPPREEQCKEDSEERDNRQTGVVCQIMKLDHPSSFCTVLPTCDCVWRNGSDL